MEESVAVRDIRSEVGNILGSARRNLQLVVASVQVEVLDEEGRPRGPVLVRNC